MGPRVELIIKLAERCNINCTYCYYFEGNSKRFMHRSPTITQTTVDALCNFIARSLEQQEAGDFRLIFHGGEPLLIGKKKFELLCKQLYESVDQTKVSLCLQTNATLIDSEWIDLFQKYRISVSMSLDGTQPMHDLSRVDKKGRGTYEQTIRGLRLLSEAVSDGKLDGVGCLVVVNPSFSGRDIYNHIVQDLGIRTLDFLLPDTTHDTFTGDMSSFSRYLIEVFDAWWDQKHKDVHLRFMKSVVSLLLGGPSFLGGFGGKLSTAFTVSSDGDIELDDFLRVCGDDVIAVPIRLSDASLTSLTRTDTLMKIEREYAEIPLECNQCAFKFVCRGGQLTHRFAKVDGFIRKSVYCGALYDLFEHAAHALVIDGIPIERIANRLKDLSPNHSKNFKSADSLALA